MFGGHKKGNKRNKSKGKGKNRPTDDSQKQNNQTGNNNLGVGAPSDMNGNDMMGMNQDMDYGGQNGVHHMDETEMILLNLHSSLIDFYSKHKPENVDEDVLTILMQFFIDAGGVALNKKLKDKYGEDLNTFKKAESEAPPPPLEMEYNSKTMQRMKRASLEKNYEINLPPPPAYETNVDQVTLRKSMSAASSPANDNTVRKKKKPIKDKALMEFKAGKNRELSALEASLEEDLFGDRKDEPQEDPSLRLDLLDKPDSKKLTPRDFIEAFYSKYDESKLESDTGVEKFVMWVEQHSLDELSRKLKGKYKEGLEEQEKLARRRRNLEDKLTDFYIKHDRPKLETRWTILKILSWTMTHGVVALNKKFMTRYGFPVVEVKTKNISVDELDI